MRFAHIADVHLGRHPDAGTQWEENSYREIYDGFERFIDYLDVNPVDFLFITGDLFDDVPTVTELTYVDNLFLKLKKTNIVYVTGEADYLKRGATLWNYRFMSNLYVLDSEPIDERLSDEVERTAYADKIADCLYFKKFNMDIYGVCQYSSHNERNDVDTIYVHDEKRINILLAHGGDENVCPFETDDFVPKTFNYVGVGHIHNYTENSRAKLYYPGSLEPLSYDETGEHGFIRGYVDRLVTDVRFVPFADRKYESIEIPVSDDMSDTELVTEISVRCNENKNHIYTISLIRGDDCYMDFCIDTLRKKYRILDIIGDKNDKISPDRLEALNRENVIGKTLNEIKNIGGKYEKKAAAIYADKMAHIIWGKDNLGLVAQMADIKMAEEAQKYLENDIKEELKRLHQGVSLCDSEEKKLSERKCRYDDIVGQLNIIRAKYGELEYELSQIDYEEAQINRIYSMNRIGFIGKFDFPLIILIILIATAGAVVTFFWRKWDEWLNLIIILICVVLGVSIISFRIYNATKGLRKRLKGDELPVEKHARLADKRTQIEEKMHEADIEINRCELDLKMLGNIVDEQEKMKKRRKKLIEHCGIYENIAAASGICDKKNLALTLE